MASGATDVLAGARVVATLGEALDGITYACATAMTARDFGPPNHAPRELFAELAPSSHRVAFVFGSERFGLANDDVYACHACLTIPTDPALRLAQPGAGDPARRLRLAPGAAAASPRRRAARRAAQGRRGRGARPARALAGRARAARLSRPGGAEEADGAAAPAGQPRRAQPGRGAHPARHRPSNRRALPLNWPLPVTGPLPCSSAFAKTSPASVNATLRRVRRGRCSPVIRACTRSSCTARRHGGGGAASTGLGALHLAPRALFHRHRDPPRRDDRPARLHRSRHGRGLRRDRRDRRRLHDLSGRDARRHLARQGRQAPPDARPRRHRRRQLAGARRLHRR